MVMAETDPISPGAFGSGDAGELEGGVTGPLAPLEDMAVAIEGEQVEEALTEALPEFGVGSQ